MTRLVDDSGCSMNGGAAHVGSVGVTDRDAAPARAGAASSRSVPALEDAARSTRAAATDFERITSRPGDAVERLLERHRDELLDLRGGQARRRRLDLDPRRRELGEHVDRHVAQLLRRRRTSCADGERHDEEPEPQARTDDPAHHGGVRLRLSVLYAESRRRRSSAAPTRHDARCPAGGPSEQARPVAVDAVDRRSAARTNDQRLGVGVHPRVAVGVVDDRARTGSRSLPPHPPATAAVSSAEPFGGLVRSA